MKRNLILAICMAITVFTLSSFRTVESKATVRKNFSILNPNHRLDDYGKLGTVSYDDGFGHVLTVEVWVNFITYEYSYNMKVAINGSSSYALFYDGTMNSGAHSLYMNNVIIYYFGETNGSFTVPTGTYAF